MDPTTGRLFSSVHDAKLAGVKHPVHVSGKPEDVERLSEAVKKLHDAEEKVKARNKAKRKAATRARKQTPK